MFLFTAQSVAHTEMIIVFTIYMIHGTTTTTNTITTANTTRYGAIYCYSSDTVIVNDAK